MRDHRGFRIEVRCVNRERGEIEEIPKQGEIEETPKQKYSLLQRGLL